MEIGELNILIYNQETGKHIDFIEKTLIERLAKKDEDLLENFKELSKRKDFEFSEEEFSNLKIDTDFAKELRLFDIISLNCVSLDEKTGNQMLQYFESEFSLILIERSFGKRKGKYNLLLTFEIVFRFDVVERHRELISKSNFI